MLRAEFDKPYWKELQQFVADERARHTVFPPPDQVFAALHLTPYESTRVVMLGQDPYHGPQQAHGLCFSVQGGVQLPPSLVNIYKELRDDLGIETPDHGNLESWARQGVLMLNTSLTVRVRRRRFASGQRLGDVHRRGLARRRREATPCRVHPVGCSRPQEEGTDRSVAAHGDRVRAPVASQRPQRILRQQAVQPHQRSPRRRRPAAHRLAPPAAACDRVAGQPAGLGYCRGLRLGVGRCRSSRRRRGRTACPRSAIAPGR